MSHVFCKRRNFKDKVHKNPQTRRNDMDHPNSLLIPFFFFRVKLTSLLTFLHSSHYFINFNKLRDILVIRSKRAVLRSIHIC